MCESWTFCELTRLLPYRNLNPKMWKCQKLLLVFFILLRNVRTFLTCLEIRSYIEDITQIKDLHIPNLITYITDKYSNYLTYFEFIDFNGYGPGVQHIYRKDESLIGKIPEFLNINTANTENHALDINLIVK